MQIKLSTDFRLVAYYHATFANVYSTIKAEKRFTDEGLADRSGNPFFVLSVLRQALDDKNKKRL